MKLGKIVACLGVGALCVVTGGLAAPAIGAAVGTSVLGLSGAAATSAGLAALGGGSLAAGGLGMAGGTALIQAVAGGIGLVGAGIATNSVECNKAKQQNKELREALRKSNLDNKTKQDIITNLKAKIDKLNQAVAEEKSKNQRNEEKIKILQEQLDDVIETLHVAEAA